MHVEAAAIDMSPSTVELEQTLGAGPHCYHGSIAGRSPSRTDAMPRLLNPVATVLFGNQSPAAQQAHALEETELMADMGDREDVVPLVLRMSNDRHVTNPGAAVCCGAHATNSEQHDVGEDINEDDYNSDTFELDEEG